MAISVSSPDRADRNDWEALYHGYAEFYQVPMNGQILDTVWGWIHDDSNPFFGLIAKDENGKALGLMHCRQMASPLRGALVGFLDDLLKSPSPKKQQSPPPQEGSSEESPDLMSSRASRAKTCSPASTSSS